MNPIRSWIDAHLQALTFDKVSVALPGWLIAITWVLHLLGLAATIYLLQQPIWIAPLTLVLLLSIPMFAYRTRGLFATQTLAPLFFLYALVAARFVFIRVFHGDVPGYFDYNLPDLRSTFFRLGPWTICAFVYTFAIQIRYLANQAWLHVLVLMATLVVVITFVWAGVLYIGQRTHGVTGTDPYAYMQMGVDLATRGTPLHRFTLFPSVASLNIAWSPIVHTGYHIPIDASGDAPTVWPIGGSFAFALAYRLGGEAGLYLVNPLMSLFLLAATGWLAWELFADSKQRAWVVALSVALFATSHTLFDWATVPMVDSQAALFSVLAIMLSLRAARWSNAQHGMLYAMLSGFALSAAYLVRHTQVLIVPAVFILLWANALPRAVRVRALIVAGVASLLVALPDLWYHQTVFGSWLTPESTELNLFSIASIGSTMSGLSANLLAAREFGWLLPFLLYGAYRLARSKRIEFIVFALWVTVLFGFHLLYPALRPRDLLPEFLPLVIVIAYGVVAFIGALWQGTQSWGKLVAAAGLIITLFLLLIRVWNVLPIPFGEPQRAFGYLTAEQHAAFDQIAALTPARAVIGSTLNTGAIDLYAQRETFLPAMWSPQEQDTFFAAMLREGRTIYLLDDSAGMTIVRRQLETRYALRQIAVLDVPLSSALPNETNGALYEIIGYPR